MESVHRGHLKKTEGHEILCSGKYGFKNVSAHHVQNACPVRGRVPRGAPRSDRGSASRAGGQAAGRWCRGPAAGVPCEREWGPAAPGLDAGSAPQALFPLLAPAAGTLGGPWSLARQRELPRPGWVRGGRGLGRCLSRPAETPACTEKWGDRKHMSEMTCLPPDGAVSSVESKCET